MSGGGFHMISVPLSRLLLPPLGLLFVLGCQPGYTALTPASEGRRADLFEIDGPWLVYS